VQLRVTRSQLASMQSVSCPLQSASARQSGTAHNDASHHPVSQSMSSTHAAPAAQAWHSAPPQSTSVSSWLFAPSLHRSSSPLIELSVPGSPLLLLELLVLVVGSPPLELVLVSGAVVVLVLVVSSLRLVSPVVVVGRPLVVPVLPVLPAVSVSGVPLMNGGSTGSEQAGRMNSKKMADNEGRMAGISFGRGKISS